MTQPSPQVKNVIFDIGRVLYRWSPRFLYEKLIDDPARLDWFLAEVVTEEWHFQHDTGRPLAQMIAERVPKFPAERALIELYQQRWLETIPGPVPGSHALVDQLAARGIPLYCLTNFGADTWAMFRPTARVLDHFRDILVSGHEKLAKPDPAIFELARRRFGVVPGETLFIDDSQANVDSAAACGFQVHWFKEAGALEADLRERELID